MRKIYAGYVFVEEKIVLPMANIMFLWAVAMVFIETIRRYVFKASFVWAQELEVFAIAMVPL